MFNFAHFDNELLPVLNLIPDIVKQQITENEYKIIKPFALKMLTFVDDLGHKIPHTIIADFVQLLFKFLRNDISAIDWNKIKEIKNEEIVNANNLDSFQDLGQANLNKLVVLKLNGGLGTTMGLRSAKSSIIVDLKRKKTFLHLIKEQLDELNLEFNCKIPLWFLNSFHTKRDTEKILSHDSYFELLQNEFPRIKVENNESYVPFEYQECPTSEWYPPGHGDLYRVFKNKKFLEQMIADGKEYLFVSNADNLGATVDLGIIGYVISNKVDFLMEVSKKTVLDKKGGILVNYNDKLSLVEAVQVSAKYQTDFENINKFSYFNTNSLWFNIKKLLEIINHGFELPILINKKKIQENQLIQLETAMGAIISYFPNAQILDVPKSRFLPVKTNRELLLLRSDLIKKEKKFVVNKERARNNLIPEIVLSPNYCCLDKFENYLQNVPSLINVDLLSLNGEVFFSGKTPAILQGKIVLESIDKPLEISDMVSLTDISIKVQETTVEIKSLNSKRPVTQEKNGNQFILKGFDLQQKSWQTKLLIFPDRVVLTNFD